MTQLTTDDLYRLVRRHGADNGAADCAVAGALAESGGDTEAVGDNGHSRGIWQMHDEGLGAGMTAEQRMDPDSAAAIMVPRYLACYLAGIDRGYQGEALARYGYMATEMPLGWQGVDAPGLDSAAAERFAGYWRPLQAVPMPTVPNPHPYDPDYYTPPYQQRNTWTCAICATAWALGSLSIPVRAPDLQDPMVAAGLVNSIVGLRRGDGTALEAWIAETYRLRTERAYPASWEWVQARAGKGPLLLGGAAWNHWVGGRRAGSGDWLQIANSADGWMGVGQALTRADFDRLGAFAAIWLPVEAVAPEPEPPTDPAPPSTDPMADCINLLGNIQGDWADAAIAAILAAKATPQKGPRNAQLDAALAALATIKRGGPPEEA